MSKQREPRHKYRTRCTHPTLININIVISIPYIGSVLSIHANNNKKEKITSQHKNACTAHEGLACSIARAIHLSSGHACRPDRSVLLAGDWTGLRTPLRSRRTSSWHTAIHVGRCACKHMEVEHMTNKMKEYLNSVWVLVWVPLNCQQAVPEYLVLDAAFSQMPVVGY